MKNIYRPVVSDFNGGGTIVISNSDMLTITGSVTGTTAFETAGGFGGESGIAQAGHTYITAPNSNENSFTVMIVDENSEEGNGSLIAITDSTGNSVTTINAGSFSAKAVIPTKTNKSTVMIAKYNGDELKKIRIYSANVITNENYTVKETDSISVSENKVSNGVRIKAFIFENLENVKPLCKPKEI